MPLGWTSVKRFLVAEEVPRWFGLSLIAIYLVGLGSVAHYGIAQTRREGAVHLERCSRYSIKLLAERLGCFSESEISDASLSGALQRVLRHFASSVPVSALRVVDSSGRIVASLDPREAGTLSAAQSDAGTGADVKPTAAVHTAEGRDVLVRERFTMRLSPAKAGQETGSAGDAEKVLYLEAGVPLQPPGVSDLPDQALTLAIVLVVLGALFIVYRCLREQLRGIARIVERLQLHRDRLEAELSALSIADTADDVTAAWNELVDLTQRLLDTVRRSEATAELSRALQSSGGGALAEALSAVPDAIIYIADEGRLEYVNSAACRLLGWNVKDARQTTLSDAKAQGIGGRVLDLLRNALQPDGNFQSRNEVLTAGDGEDGTPTAGSSYRVQVMPLQRSQRQGQCVVIVRDVSQQLRCDRAREEFITQVTHELRTPLTNIRAYTETLSSGMFDDPSLVTECYNVITKETRRLSRLVEDILSVSQLEVGSIELVWGEVDLKTLLSDGVRDVRGLADEKDIDLQLVLPAKTEPLRGDRDKLAVVVNNLLGNALKYTPKSGNVVVGCQFARNEVIITFKDNGIGVDATDYARIFEKFQRGSDPQAQSEPGTGIGLYTAREIVRRHGGEIELVSEKGKGSTFLVRLPHEESRAAVLTSVQEA